MLIVIRIRVHIVESRVTACEYNTVRDKRPGNEKNVDGTDGGLSSTVVLLRYKDGSSDLGPECKLEFGVDKKMAYSIKQ